MKSRCTILDKITGNHKLVLIKNTIRHLRTLTVLSPARSTTDLHAHHSLNGSLVITHESNLAAVSKKKFGSTLAF